MDLHKNISASFVSLLIFAGCSGAPDGRSMQDARSAMMPSGTAASAITVSPNPLLFTSVGETRSITIKEPGFTGKFAIAVPRGCDRLGFLPADVDGPVATIRLRSAVPGSCDLTISGGGKRVIERVEIASPG